MLALGSEVAGMPVVSILMSPKVVKSGVGKSLHALAGSR